MKTATLKSISVFSILLHTLIVSAQIKVKSNVFVHDPIALDHHFYYNHNSQIVVLDSGITLPNNAVLNTKRRIVSALSGRAEAQPDQNGWLRYSDDGLNWNHSDTIATPTEVAGNKHIFPASLFKNSIHQVFSFYLYVENPIGSSTDYPMKLKYRKSNDGGLNWTPGSFVNILSKTPLDSLRIQGPLGKPLYYNDSIHFALYYRKLGNPTAYFAMLICDNLLNSCRLTEFETIFVPDPDKIIEPVMFFSADSLVTYFRNNSGRIAYITSADSGKSWSALNYINYKDPSALMAHIKVGDKNYLVSNLASARSSLSITSGEHPKWKYIAKIDSATGLGEMITYPSLDKDNQGNIHMTYSYFVYDTSTGLRSGDIRYVMLDTTFSGLPEYTWKDESEPRPNTGNILVSFIENEQTIYGLTSTGNIHIIQRTTPSQSTIKINPSTISSIYSFTRFNKDSLVLNSNLGLQYYNEQNSTFGSPIPTWDQSRFQCYENYCIAWQNRELRIYNRSSLVSTINFPLIGNYDPLLHNLFSNIVSVHFLNADSILVLNDLGILYLLNKVTKTYQRVLNDIPLFLSSGLMKGYYPGEFFLIHRYGYIRKINFYTQQHHMLPTQSTGGWVGTYFSLTDNKHILLAQDRLLTLDNSGTIQILSYFDFFNSYASFPLRVIDVSCTTDSIMIIRRNAEREVIPFECESIKLSVDKTENVKNNSVGVYPNPSTGTFYLKDHIQDVSKFTIYNSLGAEIKYSLIRESDRTSISITNYVPGLYFIQNGSKTQKLILR